MGNDSFNEEYYLLYTSTPTELYESDNNDFNLDEYEFDEIPLPDDIKLIEFNVYGTSSDKVKSFDIHSDGALYVISDKMYQVINTFNISTIQLIPALLRYKKKEPIEGYRFLYIHKSINCLDKESSEYEWDDFAKQVHDIEKMRLDSGILTSIPLENRLVFSLGEMYTHRLFHKSVVEAIMATDPKGIRFVKVNDFHIGSAFD